MYSVVSEVVVDFTRDYDTIRQALKRIQHFDKTNIESMLQFVSNIIATNWGTQNYCQVIIFTDCGIGLGQTSLKKTIANISSTAAVATSSTTPNKLNELDDYSVSWLRFLNSSKLNFICMGSMNDLYFVQATQLYQQFLDVSGQKGGLFIPRSKEMINNDAESGSDEKCELNRSVIKDMIQRMCEINYKQFEATLKCGGYFRLEGPICIWPPPMPYKSKDSVGRETLKVISRKLEICGFLLLSDIGSPVSVSRHLIVSKVDNDTKTTKKSSVGDKYSKTSSLTSSTLTKLTASDNEFEKIENEIKNFYTKGDGLSSDNEDGESSTQSEHNRESVCVLLHGAMKIENMAALVLLNDDWYGFIYSYADSKKKSNLMLNILPPGNDVIPWMGDLRLLGFIDDALPGENPSFPVKPEKRSYSQNCVVWIKQAGLQSDIQKVLRHAKKLPEKTPHFYKELNRIRRAALSLGFVELLEGLANIFEREITVLSQSASPDCAIQLKHAAMELRKIANRDLKASIVAQPTKYNQL